MSRESRNVGLAVFWGLAIIVFVAGIFLVRAVFWLGGI